MTYTAKAALLLAVVAVCLSAVAQLRMEIEREHRLLNAINEFAYWQQLTAESLNDLQLALQRFMSG